METRLRTNTTTRNPATKIRPSRAWRLWLHAANRGTRAAAFLVSMVPTARVWESSDDMIAANTPAASMPASTLPACSRINRMMTGPVASRGTSSRPSAPSTTEGNQTAAMQAG